MSLHEEILLTNSSNREALLQKALSGLEENERKVIFLRFWNPLSIFEISKILKISWQETDQLIEATLQKLKLTILKLEKGEMET